MTDLKTQIKVFKKFMEETGYTEEEISEKTRVPIKIIRNLVSGKSIITTQYAQILEGDIGIGMEEWGDWYA